jgi:hypothetical protein
MPPALTSADGDVRATADQEVGATGGQAEGGNAEIGIYNDEP